MSCSVVSDSLQPQGLYPARLLYPGKNTRVGRHALLQGIFLTQESNPGLPHCRQILYCLTTRESPGYVSEDGPRECRQQAKQNCHDIYSYCWSLICFVGWDVIFIRQQLKQSLSDLTAGVGTFFLKMRDNKYFRLCWPDDTKLPVCHNQSTQNSHGRFKSQAAVFQQKFTFKSRLRSETADRCFRAILDLAKTQIFPQLL